MASSPEAHCIEREGWRNLRIHGADARAWLHRILSNDVKTLAPSAGAWNLLLDDRGRIQAVGLLLCEGEDRFALWSEDEQRDTWRAKLDYFLFTERVELAPSDDDAVLELAGERAPEVLQRCSSGELPLGRGAHRALRLGDLEGRCVLDGRGPTPCYLLLVARAQRARWLTALESAGAPPASEEHLRALRIRDGIASFRSDAADGVRPAEAAMSYAFDLDKGCYPGQETVARMDTYGGPPRRLFGLLLPESSAAPVPGTRVLLGESEIGRTGSSAVDPSSARAIALALIAKKAWSPGLAVALGNGEAATLCELPFETIA